jgi:hypothetical protein
MREDHMNTLHPDLQTRLKELAYRKSKPFCYSCYRTAPAGRCEICQSDDLMRELAGDGVDWGTDWIIEHLIRENLTPINVDEEFEESVRQCYPETVTIGWLTLDTVSTIRDADPVSWRCALADWLSNEEGDGLIVTLDNGATYYRTSDIEDYLDSESAEKTASLKKGM